MRLEYWLYTIPLRLRSLFRGAPANQDLDDALRDHLERKTEEYLTKLLVSIHSRPLEGDGPGKRGFPPR